MSEIALSIAIVALFISLAAALLAVGATLRVHAGPSRLVHSGLEPGAEVPLAQIAAVDEQLADASRGEAVITFVSANCEPCQQLST